MKSILIIIGDFETPDAEYGNKSKFESALKDVVSSRETIQILALNVLLIKANDVSILGDVHGLCKVAKRTYNVIFLTEEIEMASVRFGKNDNLS